MGGLAADAELVVAGARDALDKADVFVALDAATGEVRWRHTYLAGGKLDYGNSPRATPLLLDDSVITLGALGDLRRLDRRTGKPIWKQHLVRPLGGVLPIWGYSGTPLLLDDALIVQPGGAASSLVALDVVQGRTIWSTPGHEAAFASFVVVEHEGRRQLVGYDAEGLGGWDPQTGQRLWEVRPERSGDFNVVTPLVKGSTLVVCSENNGTRVLGYSSDGLLEATPLARNFDLAPDMHSPVVVGERILGVSGALFCLGSDLRTIWTSDDAAYSRYASAIASDDRVLLVTQDGLLILIDALADEYRELARLSLGMQVDVYSHPAIVERRLYLRLGREIRCLDLDDATR